MTMRVWEQHHAPVSRAYTTEADTLPGYDYLQNSRLTPPTEQYPGFAPNPHYAAYMNMHKVFVGKSGGRTLIEISEGLGGEWLPDYLNAGGWAAAEAGLVCDDLKSSERMQLLDRAERYWQTALTNQQILDDDPTKEHMTDPTDQLRLAINLAFTPIMKAIVAGNVTRKIREQTFADTLAISQLSSAQMNLASTHGHIDTVGDHLGFGHECNALLALLYVNDPNYVPIPSTYRAGSGYEYRSQTHDITVINQHWGTIHRVLPAEIKASASFRDKQRYKALIIRGKMHLTLPGKHQPAETTNAFGRCFEGTASEQDKQVVSHATNTIKELFSLYQKGECPDEFKQIRTQTKFHGTSKLAEKYREYSLEKRQ